MGMEFTNRKDQTYYLHEGKTKTSKPKFYCSRKPPEVPIETMPDGYEWRENPASAVVSVRKIRPTRIAEFEKDMLIEGIRRQAGLEAFIVDVTQNSLVVYLSDRQPADVERVFGTLFGESHGKPAAMGAWAMGHAHYSPMMRFNLINEDERLFSIDCWCFRGSVDDWYHLFEQPAPLGSLIAKYVPHLGQESFYELM